MSADSQFTILEPFNEGFRVDTQAMDGTNVIQLKLSGAEQLSDGRLHQDEATAKAVMEYLLEQQDAADLPERVEIETVLAAYPDAADKIAAKLA